MKIKGIANVSGKISMFILSSCYMLRFVFYLQFDQFDEAN